MAGFCVTSAHATNEARGEIPVNFGILLEHGDPIGGQVLCFKYKPCQLLETDDLQLSIHIDASENTKSTLSIECGVKPCSFLDGKSTALLNNQRQFDFYEEMQNTVETLLVLKPKIKMGRILLKYP